jgi:ABC-type sugar transport system permease subunit
MLQKELRKLILVFIVPPIIVWLILNIYPMASAFYWAMTEYDGMTSASNVFTGLENYRLMMDDSRWWEAMANTFIIAIGLIATILPVSLLFAVLITNTIKGQGFFKTFVYLPSVLPTVIVALLWVFILDPTVGLLGGAVDAFNIRQPLKDLLGVNNLNFVGNPDLARWTVVLVSMWAAVGGYTIYFLAGLARIPTELYDAAHIDGAQGWKLFTNITFPLLYPTIQTITLLLIINSLQNFGFIYVFSGGTPGSATQVMSTYIYRTAFTDHRFGYATALGTIMMVVVLFFTLTSRRLTRRETIQF